MRHTDEDVMLVSQVHGALMVKGVDRAAAIDRAIAIVAEFRREWQRRARCEARLKKGAVTVDIR